VRIAISTIIVQGLHTGDSDRNLGETFAPRPPETISDDDWDRKFQPFFQFAMELSRGAVRVFREQKRMAAAVDVRSVHAAVGADQAVARFRDQNPALASHYSLTLCESHFSYSGVEIVTPCPSAGTCRGLDFVEGNELAFRLRYDFVFYDQDVACLQREFKMLESLEEFVCYRVARMDIIDKRDWKNAKL